MSTDQIEGILTLASSKEIVMISDAAGKIFVCAHIVPYLCFQLLINEGVKHYLCFTLALLYIHHFFNCIFILYYIILYFSTSSIQAI